MNRLKRTKQWLDEFDQNNARRLRNFFGSIRRAFQRSDQKLDHVDEIVWEGASKRIVKKKLTGKYWKDRPSHYWFKLFQLLDKFDTFVWFRGRPHQTKTCRVRSKAEKKVANFFTDHGIRFVYEKPLGLLKADYKSSIFTWLIIFLINHGDWFPKWFLKKRGIICFKPDFYIIQRNAKVYIEYWGMVYIDPKYKALHYAKLKLYQQNGIPLISIYPYCPKDTDDLSVETEHATTITELATRLPTLFKQVTGKELEMKLN